MNKIVIQFDSTGINTVSQLNTTQV